MTHTLTLRDGRTLAYEEYGDPDGTPVLSFHGGLSSRLDASPAAQAAADLNIRLISPDRPGMGLSTNQPGRTLLDWPKDIEDLADALHLEHFAVMGWSCGGAYAAVTSAKLPERTTSVALLSSAVPLDKFGTTKGLSSDDRVLLFLTVHAPRIASAVMHLAIGGASEARLYREMERSFPPVDRAVLKEHRHDAVAMIKESMRHGTAGCLQDYRVFGAAWGFELEEIDAPTDIWEGTDDHTGPPEYREYLAAHIPHASIHLVPHEGHLSLLPHHAHEILGALVAASPR
jgi:pimeloyl-ACP methyl ester carboxylesterase